MKPRIHLVVNHPDGRESDITIEGDNVNPAMLAAAEDLLQALTTPRDGMYELCALAFGTTRDDAKKRIQGAVYGKRGKPIT